MHHMLRAIINNILICEASGIVEASCTEISERYFKTELTAYQVRFNTALPSLHSKNKLKATS